MVCKIIDMLVLMSFLYILMQSHANANKTYFLSDEFIEKINAAQNFWVAGRNFDHDTPREVIQRLFGYRPASDDQVEFDTEKPQTITGLPESFDSRQNWPNCPSLSHIYDQSGCGSCWAVSSAAVLTDRYCIQSNGQQQFKVSSGDILSCVGDDGCWGNSVESVFKYWINEGVVSGGDYGSDEGCKPYPFKKCKHFGKDRTCTEEDSPLCIRKCREGYNKTYKEDKQKGNKYIRLPSEEAIMSEIYRNGPVVATFAAYEDLVHYKSGVYKHTKCDCIGYHAVRLLGWGVEHGMKYWLVTNSWNEDWGDHGYFKILRGVNECNIEEDASVGI